MKNQLFFITSLLCFVLCLFSCGKDGDVSPNPSTSCLDGIQNGNETGIDCGGNCPACPTCTDGIQNGNETDVDCGGDCPECPPTKSEAIVGIWEVKELSLNGNDYFDEFGVRKLYFNFREDLTYESFIISKNGESDLNPSTYSTGINHDISISNQVGTDNYNCVFSEDYQSVTLTGSNVFETVALLVKVNEDLCADNTCQNNSNCLYGHCICPSGFIGEDCSGKIGPAGGIQIYDRGNNSGSFRYIEVSRNIFDKAPLGCTNINTSIVTSPNIGGGAANCAIIQIACGGTLAGDAVSNCLNYSQNGFDDWYLPSYNELDLVYPYINEIFGCPEEGTLLLSSHYDWNLNSAAIGINCHSNDGFTATVITGVSPSEPRQYVAIRYYD